MTEARQMRPHDEQMRMTLQVVLADTTEPMPCDRFVGRMMRLSHGALDPVRLRRLHEALFHNAPLEP